MGNNSSTYRITGEAPSRNTVIKDYILKIIVSKKKIGCFDNLSDYAVWKHKGNITYLGIMLPYSIWTLFYCKLKWKNNRVKVTYYHKQIEWPMNSNLHILDAKVGLTLSNHKTRYRSSGSVEVLLNDGDHVEISFLSDPKSYKSYRYYVMKRVEDKVFRATNEDEDSIDNRVLDGSYHIFYLSYTGYDFELKEHTITRSNSFTIRKPYSSFLIWILFQSDDHQTVLMSRVNTVMKFGHTRSTPLLGKRSKIVSYEKAAKVFMKQSGPFHLLGL